MSDIAIIGMVCRFPGAGNIDEFWENLTNSKETITFFEDDELIKNGVHPEVINQPQYVKALGVLEDIDLFDAEFFNYSDQAAKFSDPQHRVFLEQAWTLLESAGYSGNFCDERIGVYVGTGRNKYYENNIIPFLNSSDTPDPLRVHLSNDKDFLATRLSYYLNLKGPSITVQTACSTSLVAVHLACESLLNQESDLTMAGGITLHIPQKQGYFYEEGGTLSPDGHCRAFDADAKGMVPGSGIGIVLLRRLEDALAERDTIHAVIKGTAINNDGSDKVSFPAPSIRGQAGVIADSQAIAGIKPEDLVYLEAHGTGTKLGDPIEIEALRRVFQSKTNKNQFCAIGSVKTNIGHLDVASGMAGLIKSVLVLKHRLIPATLHFKNPNPQIELERSPFFINNTPLKIEDKNLPLRAGVSSFGMGGTNAHVILEESPLPDFPPNNNSAYHLLPISAKTEKGMKQASKNLLKFLKKNSDLNISHVAYTLQIGREFFNHRQFILCHNLKSAIEKLEYSTQQNTSYSLVEEGEKRVVFIFLEGGVGYINLARELYEEEAYFRQQLDDCFDILKGLNQGQLKEQIYPELEGGSLQPGAELAESAVLISFIFEYSLAKLFIVKGVKPSALQGLGTGKYAAACLAEVLSLEDALSLLSHYSLYQKTKEPQLYSEVLSLSEKIQLSSSKIPIFSEKEERYLSDEEIRNPKYWEIKKEENDQQGQKPDFSHFADSLLVEMGIGKAVELSENKGEEEKEVSNYFHALPRLGEKLSALEVFYNTIGFLWLDGGEINWKEFNKENKNYRIPLPTYPFERKTHWLKPKKLLPRGLYQSNDTIEESDEEPIFIACHARSGSTLLRYILDTHEDIDCPQETQLCDLVMELHRVLSLLPSDDPFTENFEQQIIDESRHYINLIMQSRLQKKIWCDKSMRTIDNLSFMRSIFPEARFICLYRHCMDFLHSAMEVSKYSFKGYGFDKYILKNPGNILDSLVHLWCDKVELLLDFEHENPSNSFHIRYEDIVLNTQETIEDLFSFLNLTFDSNLLDKVFQTTRGGYGDVKILFTKTIDKNILGKGHSVPTNFIEKDNLERMNSLLHYLDYETVDDDWNSRSNSFSNTNSLLENVSQPTDSEELSNVIESRLAKRFNHSAPPEILKSEILQLKIKGLEDDIWRIEFNDKSFNKVTDSQQPSTIELEIDKTIIRQILNQEINPAIAYWENKIKVTGEMDVATEIAKYLFV